MLSTFIISPAFTLSFLHPTLNAVDSLLILGFAWEVFPDTLHIKVSYYMLPWQLQCLLWLAAFFVIACLITDQFPPPFVHG